MRFKYFVLGLVAFVLLAPVAALRAQSSVATKSKAAAHRHRVIFVITSGDEADWAMTVKNITALVAGLKPEPVEIEVLAYGPGIVALKKDSSMAADIAALQSARLRFVACSHAMAAHHLTAADLAAGVVVVPSGIVELVRRQEGGWVYVKAGR